MIERETHRKKLRIAKRIVPTTKDISTSKNAWVHSMENSQATKCIHNYFCKCGCSFKNSTAINHPFAPDVSCPKCNHSAFIDTQAFTKDQLLDDEPDISWGIEAFENTTLWGVHVYIDLPVYIEKEEVALQRKKILRLHMHKKATSQSEKPYELSYYGYIASIYRPTKHSKQKQLKYIAKKALSNFIMQHKRKEISWLSPEDMAELSSDDKLLCIHYFLNHPHLQEFNFYFWDMVFLQNYTKEYSSELIMLNFISNFRKEKSVKKALYTTYKHAIDTAYYNPHSDFVFSRTIEDTNLLVKLILLDLKIKQYLFEDTNYLEGMDLLIFLKKHYTEKQICKLFIKDLQNNKQSWKDILRMMQRDNAFTELEKYFVKTRLTMEALHDEIVRALHVAEFSYLDSNLFHFNEEILSTQGISANLKFQLPSTVAELSLWSKLLHNCMFAYAESITNGSSVIYGVFKEEKLLYALELARYNIVQAKSVSNRSVPHEDMQKINDWYKKNLEVFKQASLKPSTGSNNSHIECLISY